MVLSKEREEIKMKYVRIECTVGYIGCDENYYLAFPDNWDDDQIEQYANELVDDNGQTWEYLAVEDINREDFETDEDYEHTLEDEVDSYWGNVGGYWEEITEDEWAENNGEVIEN